MVGGNFRRRPSSIPFFFFLSRCVIFDLLIDFSFRISRIFIFAWRVFIFCCAFDSNRAELLSIYFSVLNRLIKFCFLYKQIKLSSSLSWVYPKSRLVNVWFSSFEVKAQSLFWKKSVLAWLSTDNLGSWIKLSNWKWWWKWCTNLSWVKEGLTKFGVLMWAVQQKFTLGLE